MKTRFEMKEDIILKIGEDFATVIEKVYDELDGQGDTSIKKLSAQDFHHILMCLDNLVDASIRGNEANKEKELNEIDAILKEIKN